MFDKLKKWLTMEDDTAEPSVLPKEELKAPVPPVKAPRKPKDSKPELTPKEIADGNEIGNHSMTHPRLNTLPLDEVRDEITQCEAAVLKATGVTTRLLRPPGERYNDNDLLVAKKLHYITVAANIGANDYIVPGDRSWYRGNPGYQDHLDSISKSVFKQLKNGGIIDIHDMPTTADALEIVIKGIRSRGYKIVTVSELLGHLPGRRG